MGQNKKFIYLHFNMKPFQQMYCDVELNMTNVGFIFCLNRELEGQIKCIIYYSTFVFLLLMNALKFWDKIIAAIRWALTKVRTFTHGVSHEFPGSLRKVGAARDRNNA